MELAFGGQLSKFLLGNCLLYEGLQMWIFVADLSV
jgi:hypothetical protein